MSPSCTGAGAQCRTGCGTAYRLMQRFHKPEYARKLGVYGREHIKNNFLITRHIENYLLTFLSIEHKGDIVYL